MYIMYICLMYIIACKSVSNDVGSGYPGVDAAGYLKRYAKYW